MHQAQAPWADFSFASCVHWQLRIEDVCQQEPRCGCKERRGRGRTQPQQDFIHSLLDSGDTPTRWNCLNPEATNFYRISVGRNFPHKLPKGNFGERLYNYVMQPRERRMQVHTCFLLSQQFLTTHSSSIGIIFKNSWFLKLTMYVSELIQKIAPNSEYSCPKETQKPPFPAVKG